MFACKTETLIGKMKMVYIAMGKPGPAKDDELGPPNHRLLTSGGVGLMTIWISEAVDNMEESDESDEHVEDVGDDGAIH